MQPFQDQEAPLAGESAAESRLSREHGHAFKNIFSIIIANAEMIAEEEGEGGLVHRRLERIVAASRRGEQLIESIRNQQQSSLLASVPVSTEIMDDTETGPLHGRILVVDDEPDMVEIIRRYLMKEGLEVNGLTDSLEATEHLADTSFAYDLLLTDLEMPHCSGTELCLRVSALRPELPVVVMTGYGRSITPREMHSCRVKAWLCKPIDRGLLIATIRRLLSA
ncbi:MAG: response regulator [Desulfobulbus sp.]